MRKYTVFLALVWSLLIVGLVGCPKPQAPEKPPAEGDLQAKETVQVNPADVEALVKRVEQLGGKIEYDQNKNPVAVDLFQRQATDEDLALIAKVPTIRRVSLWGAEIHDTGIQELTKLPQLEWLVLENTNITNDGVKTLGQI
ncbi:MAG TPA: hypothetical protein PKI05_16810, partial [Thermogutta sp.]|nr:hypothetical protein [Thermogutta sp.]